MEETEKARVTVEDPEDKEKWGKMILCDDCWRDELENEKKVALVNIM